MFSGISLNRMYALKRLDFFRLNVNLRIQRSKDGGKSDHFIGSWFGVFCSISIFVLLSFFANWKVADMQQYNNIEHYSIEMKNEFGVIQNDGSNNIYDEIYLRDHTFLPSIEFTLMAQSESVSQYLQSQPYNEVLKYDSENSDFQIDAEKLKKYAKFYIKILRKGAKVEKETVMRSDMV